MTRMPASRARRLVEKLPTGFRIYPEKRSEYFWVWIYPTQAQMIRFSAHLRRTPPIWCQTLSLMFTGYYKGHDWLRSDLGEAPEPRDGQP